jgi:hypothetical protein
VIFAVKSISSYYKKYSTKTEVLDGQASEKEGVPMPLDSRKAAHIGSIVPKTWAGRQKTVTLVTESGGTQSYSAVTVIFRPLAAPDPTVAGPGGCAQPRIADTLIVSCTIATVNPRWR